MENDKNPLFIQRIAGEKYEDKVMLQFKLIGILVVPLLLLGILISLRGPYSLRNCTMAIFIFLAVVIVGNMLIVYPDGLYFYSSLLWGKHIFLREDEIISITKLIDSPKSRERIFRKAEGSMPGLELARTVEEASPLFKTSVIYNLQSTKSRLPFPFSFFLKRWHTHSWFIDVEAGNETEFLQAIKQSQFSDRLSAEPIRGWDDYWKDEGK
jgi:hypothetical protein